MTLELVIGMVITAVLFTLGCLVIGRWVANWIYGRVPGGRR